MKSNRFFLDNSLTELNEEELLNIDGGETPEQTGKRHGAAVKEFFSDLWHWYLVGATTGRTSS